MVHEVVGEDLDGAVRVEGVDGVEVVDHQTGDGPLVDELAERGVGVHQPSRERPNDWLVGTRVCPMGIDRDHP